MNLSCKTNRGLPVFSAAIRAADPCDLVWALVLLTEFHQAKGWLARNEIRTEPERTAASSVLNKENFRCHTDTVVWRLDCAVRDCSSCTPLRTHHRIPPSTYNHYFSSSHRWLMLCHYPRPNQSPSFTAVNKRRLWPHFASFLHLFWEGKKQGLNILNPFKTCNDNLSFHAFSDMLH